MTYTGGVEIREKSTTGVAEWFDTSNKFSNATGQNTISYWHHQQLVEWLGEVCNPQVGTITGGAGYTDGLYENVPMLPNMTRESGQDMECRIVVSGGEVTSVEITKKGNGYWTGEVMVVADVQDIGGTGAGFQVELASANGEIAMIKDPSSRTTTSTSYECIWLLEMHRTPGNSTNGHGFYYGRENGVDTQTWYSGHYYNRDPYTTGNYSYGNYSYQQTQSCSMWNKQGDGYTTRAIWCAEPDNTFFFITDSLYKTSSGFIKTIRDPAGNWMDEDLLSNWIVTTQNNYKSTSPTSDTSAYIGPNPYVFSRPNSANVIWVGQDVRGYDAIVGRLPDRIGTSYMPTSSIDETSGRNGEVWYQMDRYLAARTDSLGA